MVENGCANLCMCYGGPLIKLEFRHSEEWEKRDIKLYNAIATTYFTFYGQQTRYFSHYKNIYSVCPFIGSLSPFLSTARHNLPRSFSHAFSFSSSLSLSLTRVFSPFFSFSLCTLDFLSLLLIFSLSGCHSRVLLPHFIPSLPFMHGTHHVE